MRPSAILLGHETVVVELARAEEPFLEIAERRQNGFLGARLVAGEVELVAE